MKVLCLCQGGNCRSVHLAYLLKYYYGHDALACGFEKNSRDTQMMLMAWAQKIIVLESYMKEMVPLQHLHKTVAFDVGPDVWFAPANELLVKLDALVTYDKDLNP